MRPSPPSPAFASAALAFLFVAGCSFPDPKNGELACGTGKTQCPEGYACVARTNTCWKDGIDLGADGGQSAIDMATPPDGGAGSDAFSAGGEAGTDLGGPGPDTGGKDASAADAPVAPDAHQQSDMGQPDAPTTDAPMSPVDAGTACTPPKVSCDGVCIDPSAGGCCTANDCSGACMTCGTNHQCTTLKSQDDPTNRCTGTCDTTGTCKAKKGQACTAVAGGCVSGTSCADGYCCDKACSGTCEACDVTGSQGTCTLLAAGAPPRAGRTACSGTGTCAGACSGTSADCSYPTSACGTASCSESSYQAAGKCSQGTCAMPAVEACTNACQVSSGGCTGVCQPTTKGCSASGVPQVCSASGAWQDQTACQGLATCVSGTCTCAAPNTTCGSTCVNLDNDANNCGACGHSCLGGTCSSGQCQPVFVTGSLSATVKLIGVDSSNIYYDLPSTQVSNTYDAYRIAKSTLNGNGTLVYASPQGLDNFEAIIGSTLFIYDAVGGMASYTIGSSSSKSPLGVTDYGIRFADFTSSPPRYYAQPLADTSTQYTLRWYTVGTNSLVATFTENTTGLAPTDGFVSYYNFFAAGDTVFWRRVITDSNYDPTSATGLFSASATNTTRVQLAGGTTVGDTRIIDANEKSVLLVDENNYLYRVPLPSGYGTNPPTSVIDIGANSYAVEDATYLYWMNDTGSVYRCSSGNCQPTKVPLVSGQGAPTSFFQDSTALYWTRSSPNRVVRLAK